MCLKKYSCVKITLILLLTVFIPCVYAVRGNAEKSRNKITKLLTAKKIPNDLNDNATGVYTGTIAPIVVQTIASGTDADFYGMVNRVARIGSIIRPEITDMEGNVIQKGTVVIQESTRYWQAQLDHSVDLLEAAKQEFITAEQIYERYKRLSPDGSTSIQEYQMYRADYYDKLAECKSAEASVIENRQILNSCTQTAPFEGIVSKVLFIKGRASGNPQTIEITQLNPIFVKVKMSRNDANKITAETPIYIYSEDGKFVHGVFNGSSILSEDGIMLVTENKIKKVEGIHNSRIKKIRDCIAVHQLSIGNSKEQILAVPIVSIYKDNKGSYVWKAENRKTLIASKGLNPIFKVSKIYVVPGDLKKFFAGFTDIISLKNPGSLQLHDLVLTDIPKNLKNGDEVELLQERYNFMPGDSVKVVIGR